MPFINSHQSKTLRLLHNAIGFCAGLRKRMTGAWRPGLRTQKDQVSL
jgi:hypothetical protein